jgi:hypothetical protein
VINSLYLSADETLSRALQSARNLTPFPTLDNWTRGLIILIVLTIQKEHPLNANRRESVIVILNAPKGQTGRVPAASPCAWTK